MKGSLLAVMGCLAMVPAILWSAPQFSSSDRDRGDDKVSWSYRAYVQAWRTKDIAALEKLISKDYMARFDLSVREDFFSGFAGDMKALARGMMKCEQALAKDPQNAEALFWHGSGLSYDAKRAFMAGDVEKGRKIQAQAVKEMNDAVAMRPDDVSVLIPRGSIFLSAALYVPSPEVAKRDFQLAVDDYEKVLRLQTPVFSKLPVHSRAELLGGLAEAWNGLGDTKKSRGYLQRMMEEFADTSYSRRAKDVLSTAPKSGALGTTCLGCHVGAAT